jgi:hypothetical protein
MFGRIGHLRIDDYKGIKSDTLFKKENHEWLDTVRFEFFGRIDSLAENDQEEKEATPKVKVKIKAKQSDLPNGLPSLLRILENSIREK